jgi:hypothetical protein
MLCRRLSFNSSISADVVFDLASGQLADVASGVRE